MSTWPISPRSVHVPVHRAQLPAAQLEFRRRRDHELAVPVPGTEPQIEHLRSQIRFHAPSRAPTLGYEFTARTIQDFSATWDTGEIYLPGGAGARGFPGRLTTGIIISRRAAIARHWLRARCLPRCTLNPNGSIQEGSSTNLVPRSRQQHRAERLRDSREGGLLGVTARPMDTLRINADLPARLQRQFLHAHQPAPGAKL